MAEPMAESMNEAARHYDVLVVGAGNAACCAALAALDQKARVGLLEKAPKRDRGGNSALTVHMRFVYDGIDDLRPLVKGMSDAELGKQLDRMPHRTQAEVWDEFMRVTNNQADERMLGVHVAESLNTVHWLASKGHDWVPTGNVGDNILLMNGGGYGLQQRNFAILEKAGASFHYETAATALIQDATGRVVDVRALTPQGYAEFRAKEQLRADDRRAAFRRLAGALRNHVHLPPQALPACPLSRWSRARSSRNKGSRGPESVGMTETSQPRTAPARVRALPLHSTRVIEMCHAVMGPSCTMVLADSHRAA